MRADMLERLLGLAAKTGDRLVVLEGDSAVVLLPLERYEELLARGPAMSQNVSARETPESRPARREDDSTERVNNEVAAIHARTAVDGSARIAELLAATEGEGMAVEEQFYLEPVE